MTSQQPFYWPQQRRFNGTSNESSHVGSPCHRCQSGILRQRGVHMIGPTEGDTACGKLAVVG